MLLALSFRIDMDYFVHLVYSSHTLLNFKAQLYVYLFMWDSYFSGLSAEPSALIHEYTKIFENSEL